MARQHSLTGQERKIVALAALGGMLEFYDFIIYGIFSVYFAHQFFPHGNQLLSVVESYVIFVLGYLTRPLGGILFSHVGDEHGRKKVLIITIILMGLSSLGIGLLPTYASIGLLAPISLLVLRLLQGLALGGELPSTYVYISESLPDKRGSGFGVTMTGVNSGLLLGMLINQLLNSLLTPAQLTAYGWRLPFIFGGLLCLISYKIRKTLQETQAFNKIADKPDFPLLYLCRHYLPTLVAGTAITAIMAGLVVVAIVFMPTYLHDILGVNNPQISHWMPVAMLINVTTIYLIGCSANYWPPRRLLQILLAVSLILGPAAYWWLAHQYYLLALISLAILEGAAAMLVPYLVTCLFPAKVRLTGVAMCYNLAFTVFGGLAPILITSGIKAGFNSYLTPTIFVLGLVIISWGGLWLARRHSHEQL